MDSETGLYYFGARYLDPKYSRWLSTDPALGDYVPQAPVNDEAKKANNSLPGQGGLFNQVNFHLYHYAGNNPVKYVDPDGRVPVKSGPLRGTLTHIEIQNYLTTNYGGSSQFYLKSQNSGLKGSFFIDYLRDSDISSITTEIYEIKPDTYMNSQRGDKQLQKYIDRAGDGFVKGTEILDEINGTVISTNILSDNPNDFSGTITLHTDTENHPGMIFYSLDDGKTIKEKVLESATKIASEVVGAIMLLMGVSSGVAPSIPAPTLP